MRSFTKSAKEAFCGELGRLAALLLLLGLSGGALAQESSMPAAPLPSWGETPPDIPDGYMIIEGDIQVPIDFELRDMPWATNFWPNGIVPFEFDANVTNANRQAMLAAMAQWTAVANVTFRARTNEADYVHIQDSNVNDSPVGRQGGRQIINIFNWDFQFKMCHELAHTLGFWHEQSRTDRDTFVRIEFAHIQPGQENNFQLQSGSGRYGPYDFDSVMHYGQFDFSQDGQATITVLPPNEQWQTRIGQRTHLSRMDQLIMGFIYPFGNWRFVDQNFTGVEQGTFLQPFRGFIAGVNATPTGGTLWVQPGAYSARGTYTRAMTWQAPLGAVTLN
jgi:hypothetical protein